MIKAVLDSLDGVPEHLRTEYKPGEGGKFFLELDGLETGSPHPAVGSLRSAKQREHDDRVKAENERAELKKRLDAINEENEARLRGMLPKENIEALDKSWQGKLTAKEAEHAAAVSRLNGNLQRLLVDNKAQALATAIAVGPSQVPLLIPHIKARLAVDTNGEEATTRVLDREGKPSALTLDDLQKEFLADPVFAPVVLGSKATGSGAGGATSSGASGGGHGGGAPVRDPKKPLSGLSPKELGAYRKAKREAAAAGK